MTRRTPLRLWAAPLALVIALASPAGAVTLTVTPDKSLYQVGELVVLDVFGDPEDVLFVGAFGSLVFSESLAIFESAAQTPMTTFGGQVEWNLGLLSNGEGFAVAFNQHQSTTPNLTDCCLSARVVLRAVSPGELNFSWDPTRLEFFGLSSAPGGTVTIVPEPASVLSLGLGLIALARWSHSRQRHQR